MDIVAPRQASSPLGLGYRSLRGLAVAVLVLTSVQLLANLVSAASFSIGGQKSIDELVSFGGVLAALSGCLIWILSVALYIATAVVFLVWLYRAAANLRPLGSESLADFKPGRAVWGFFIPFYDLVHGYATLRHVWIESQPRAVADDNGYLPPQRAPLVGWWWGTYLAATLIGRIASKAADHAPSLDAMAGAAWTIFLAKLLPAVLFVLMVLRITRRQEAQLDDLRRREAANTPPPADRLR